MNAICNVIFNIAVIGVIVITSSPVSVSAEQDSGESKVYRWADFGVLNPREVETFAMDVIIEEFPDLSAGELEPIAVSIQYDAFWGGTPYLWVLIGDDSESYE